MADDNDKSPLTRRRVLGGMATIGAAGAVGAGTWSRFTDTEQKHVTVSGGTLDLTIDGSNGRTIYVSGDPLKNGDTFEDCETLKNVGDIAGDKLKVSLSNVTDHENGVAEPERDAEDSAGNGGELSDYLDIKGVISCPDEGTPCTPGQSAGTNGYIDLNSAEGGSVTVPDLNMGNGDTCELCFYVTLNEEGNANDAMGDSVEFDIDITLEQNPPGETVDAESSPGEADQNHNDGGNS